MVSSLPHTQADAGGSMHSSVTASLDESSGDAESDTDEYLKVDVDNSMQASGKAGFSFQVGFSTEDLNDDGEYDPSEDIAEFGLASDTDSGIGLDTIESPQPASDFTGVQFSMGVTASSKQSDNLSFGEKVRSEDYLTKTRDEISVENSSSSKSDFDFSLSHGTEDSSFSLVSSGSGNSSDVSSLDHQYIDSDTEANGTDLPAIYDNKESFDGSSGYSYTYELTLGGEDGVTETAESSWEAAVDVLSEEKWNTGNGDYIIRYEEEYRDGSEDDPETEDDDRIHLITETTIFEGDTTVETRQGSTAPTQETRSLEDILDEYLDRATQRARLEQLLNETDDPALQAYYQGLIDEHTNIMGDLASEALAAGATQGDLDNLEAQATATAAGDPIDLEEWDGGELRAGAFVGGFFVGIRDAFVDGRSWDSLQGASTQMVDVMFAGMTDFSRWISPLYGNQEAHAEGEIVGTIWGTANWIAITFGRWSPAPAGTGSLITHWARPGVSALNSGGTYWVMRGGPSLWNYVMSGTIQVGPHFRWPWSYIVTRASAGTLAAPRGWEAVKWILGQRIFTP